MALITAGCEKRRDLKKREEEMKRRRKAETRPGGGGLGQRVGAVGHVSNPHIDLIYHRFPGKRCPGAGSEARSNLSSRALLVTLSVSEALGKLSPDASEEPNGVSGNSFSC